MGIGIWRRQRLCCWILVATLILLLTRHAQRARRLPRLEYSKYVIDENDSEQLEGWVKSNCEGYTRCGTEAAANDIGGVEGSAGGSSNLAYENPPPGALCQSGHAQGQGKCNAGLQQAQYSPGQTVCVAYPLRTHVAAACQPGRAAGQGMRTADPPGARMWIFRTSVNRSSAPETLDAWEQENSHSRGVHDLGKEDYMEGSQWSHIFCEDTDRPMCTACFQLEEDIAPGVYTFLWQWVLKEKSRGIGPEDENYGYCWEAEVVVPGDWADAARVTAPTANSAAPAEDADRDPRVFKHDQLLFAPARILHQTADEVAAARAALAELVTAEKGDEPAPPRLDPDAGAEPVAASPSPAPDAGAEPVPASPSPDEPRTSHQAGQDCTDYISHPGLSMKDENFHNDLTIVLKITTIHACATACVALPACRSSAWVQHSSRCFLKDTDVDLELAQRDPDAVLIDVHPC